MLTADLARLDLMDHTCEADPNLACRVDFPFFLAKGTASTSVVYFEVDPGKRLGMHTDSAEEIVLILQGEAEAVVDGERGRLSAGGMAVIPAMAPHDVYCAGDETLRVVGFFSSPTVVSTFDEPIIPGAPLMVAVHARTDGYQVLAGRPLGQAAVAQR